MVDDAGLGVEPVVVGEVAARWGEVADLLDESRAEVAALALGVFDARVGAAAARYRDDLVRRVRCAVDEAEARSRVLRSFLGEVERQDDEVARVLDGRSR